ncbi:MAG: TRAP transporter small permease [Elusimicrobiota bacterium]|jgi:TRAP-type C4-dicarboxylate transport system permease small subunit|nr:TRAP transporter small permease [Elusimicrobiota bacterium]
MTAIKNAVDKFLQWFCIVIVVLMTFFVTYQVATRYLFNAPSAISEALARYLFVWLTMFGGAYVFGKREHMNLNFIRDKCSPKIKTILELISEFLIVVFAVMVMIYGGFVYASKQMIQVDPSLNISMGYIYGSLVLSGVLILFYFTFNARELIKKLTTKGA